MIDQSTDYNRLLTLIRKEKSFVLATHVQPDGDAIGSLLGLGFMLMLMGKEVHMSWGEPVSIPPQYAFLPGVKLLKDPSSCPSIIDNFIALDCATLDRLGDLSQKAKKAKNLVSIDHHSEKARFAHINIIDEHSSSTSEIIMRISKGLGIELNDNIALCLYVGIVTDTGRFQYSNTTQSTFDAAKELLGYGVSPLVVFQNVYENIPFQYLKLLGIVLSRASIIQAHKLIYSWILQSDLKETGARLSQTENIIDNLRSTKGMEIAVVFKELGDHKLNVSLRSNGKINVDKLAEQFGGGGHPNAAGFKSTNGIDETLRNLIKALQKQGV